eukprot:3183084-Prymnesium_polylepis.2
MSHRLHAARCPCAARESDRVTRVTAGRKQHSVARNLTHRRSSQNARLLLEHPEARPIHDRHVARRRVRLTHRASVVFEHTAVAMRRLLKQLRSSQDGSRDEQPAPRQQLRCCRRERCQLGFDRASTLMIDRSL